MQTDTMTDERAVTLLMEALGWVWHPDSDQGEGIFENPQGSQGNRFMRMTDAIQLFLSEPDGLGPIHDVEERLSEDQKQKYMRTLLQHQPGQDVVTWSSYVWLARHVTACTCAHALVEVLSPESPQEK